MNNIFCKKIWFFSLAHIITGHKHGLHVVFLGHTWYGWLLSIAETSAYLEKLVIKQKWIITVYLPYLSKKIKPTTIASLCRINMPPVDSSSLFRSTLQDVSGFTGNKGCPAHPHVFLCVIRHSALPGKAQMWWSDFPYEWRCYKHCLALQEPPHSPVTDP